MQIMMVSCCLIIQCNCIRDNPGKKHMPFKAMRVYAFTVQLRHMLEHSS